VPQWCYSKGFDTFAPLGPALVASSLIANPAELHMQTIIDGEVRQDTPLDDLIFGVPRLIAHLSAGTTLQKGSVIMTGTPGGE
jgi:2-keto-4-pentenoate hydratase/2-oxohepta-3-ene-1,7-dioic acid hydratase in catechol pathway